MMKTSVSVTTSSIVTIKVNQHLSKTVQQQLNIARLAICRLVSLAAIILGRYI